jgi:cytochrome c-type biogenesis protein CcmH/NrfG
VATYGRYFALPVWLRQARHPAPSRTGLVMLAPALVALLAVAVAALLLVGRWPRPVLCHRGPGAAVEAGGSG